MAGVAGCGNSHSVLAPASPDAQLIATLFWWMFAVGAFILIVTLGLLTTALSLRRRESYEIPFRRGATLVICGGVLAPVLAIIAVTVSGLTIGDETEGTGSASGVTIEVVGKRWWWEFRYLDRNGDTLAVTANELHLPVGERARLRLISDNVIHSFWAPNLQGKTDLIPGVVNTLYAEPDRAGEWRGQCAELCGLQHALMGFLVIAMPRAEFDTWLERQGSDAAVQEGRGWEVFRTNGCQGCHAIRGTTAVGAQGPDLTHFASRRTLGAATLENNRRNLRQWITSSDRVKPGNLMPAFDLPAEDLSALLDFLGGLE